MALSTKSNPWYICGRRAILFSEHHIFIKDAVNTKYPSVTDPVKPDPVDFFPSPSENLASQAPGEIFYFTRPVCGFPSATFTYPAYITCARLKKEKQRPDRKGQPGGKLSSVLRLDQPNYYAYFYLKESICSMYMKLSRKFVISVVINLPKKFASHFGHVT